MVRSCVDQISDWRNFRVPEAQKPASYTAEWGAKEDGMLCVGIARHGYGAWIPIRDDPELGLTDKFYLEEHRVGAKEARNTAGDEPKQAKSPGAVHLVRRANYLISVLKDKISNGTNQAAKRALENHHRNNRKHLGSYGRTSTPGHAGSPGPNAHRKLNSGDGRSFHQSDTRNSMDRRQHGSPNGHHRSKDDRGKHRYSEERRPGHGRNHSSPNGVSRPPMSEADEQLKKIFEPIEPTLVKVAGATKKKMPENEARLKMIKMGLVAIGNHINTQVTNNGHASLEGNMWEFISEHHWPQAKLAEKRVSGDKLRDMYKKISGKDNAANGAGPSPTKPKAGPSDAEPALANGSANGVPSIKAEDADANIPAPKADAPVKDDLDKAEATVKEEQAKLDTSRPNAVNAGSKPEQDAPATTGRSQAKPEQEPAAPIEPAEAKPSVAVDEKV